MSLFLASLRHPTGTDNKPAGSQYEHTLPSHHSVNDPRHRLCLHMIPLSTDRCMILPLHVVLQEHSDWVTAAWKPFPHIQRESPPEKSHIHPVRSSRASDSERRNSNRLILRTFPSDPGFVQRRCVSETDIKNQAAAHLRDPDSSRRKAGGKVEISARVDQHV